MYTLLIMFVNETNFIESAISFENAIHGEDLVKHFWLTQKTVDEKGISN